MCKECAMILKEGSEVQDIYKKTLIRGSKALRTSWTLSKTKSYWRLWVITYVFDLVFVLLALLGGWILYNDSYKGLLPVCVLIILVRILNWYIQEKGLEKEFASEYTTHAISYHPFWRRRTYF